MRPSRKVLLIGWDAADWKVINPLMDAGRMPNVQRLVDQGVAGQIATLRPPLSPMLWTSIATGKRPFKHGIHGFSEPTADGLGIQPVTNLSRRCKALWNILNQNGLRSVVIGWWPSHPAEPINGVMVSDQFHKARGRLEQGWPLLRGTVHPSELADTLAEMRLHPEDVVGPMVQAFVPRATEIDQDQDRRLYMVAKTLCECVSIHSAATWLIENQTWDLFAVYYDAIDHFSHGFMRYHPPRQEFISEKDFELYKDVLATGYTFHDQMLGALLQKVNNDVTVILMSDHGFHPDHLRPKAIPPIPAGPAIEHRDFGILALKGPGIKQDQLLHGANVLDIAPTVLTLFGLPVGADMDGKVLTGAFEQPLKVETIPSWEEAPGQDGRHSPHIQLDPVGAKESLEQLVALGYIARPDENREKAVADTIRELRYNLAMAYQDADRHAEAAEIFRELRRDDPDEQRFAVYLFVSCQALGLRDQMKEIVADLDGRRRALFEEAQVHLKEFAELIGQRRQERKAKADAAAAPAEAPPAEEVDPETQLDLALAEADREEAGEKPAPVGKSAAAQKPEPLLTLEERKELVHWRNLARFHPPVIDYLRAQVLAMERQYGEALESLGKVQEAHLARPGLFLQAAELYRKMGHWDEAEQAYGKALGVDPDNPHAHLGMCRVALRKRDFACAAESALECIQRLYHYPLGHFLLGVALVGLKNYVRAAEAFRVALSLNPNFPQAHLRLALLLQRRLNDPAGAAEHLLVYREMRIAARKRRKTARSSAAAAPVNGRTASPISSGAPAITGFDAPNLPDVGDDVVVVSGLPRSGTSMIMQMLAAGGLPVLTDGLREADPDNPRGYFEYEPVKNLYWNAEWLKEAKGKAVKIVAPLLPYLPAGAAYRVIFIERNLDEILESQDQMLIRRSEKLEDTPARRARLKEEYGRLVHKVRNSLLHRPEIRALFLNRDEVLNDPQAAAGAMNRFLGGRFAAAPMAAQVDPSLNRQRLGN
jgi:predicted AlkP superfamily phosphohydrolase/phosphomutase/tetratricopeptide (TPR) repeat protein